MFAVSFQVPRRSPIGLLPLWKDHQVHQVGLTQVSFNLVPLFWVSEHMRFCVQHLRLEFGEFSGWPVVNNLSANAGDKDLIPGPES